MSFTLCCGNPTGKQRFLLIHANVLGAVELSQVVTDALKDYVEKQAAVAAIDDDEEEEKPKKKVWSSAASPREC